MSTPRKKKTTSATTPPVPPPVNQGRHEAQCTICNHLERGFQNLGCGAGESSGNDPPEIPVSHPSTWAV